MLNGRDQHVGRSIDCFGHWTSRIVKLGCNLSDAQTGKNLWIILSPRQDVLIVNVQERHGPGLVRAVDVGRNVVLVEEPGVEWCQGLQRVAGVVSQLGGS